MALQAHLAPLPEFSASALRKLEATANGLRCGMRNVNNMRQLRWSDELAGVARAHIANACAAGHTEAPAFAMAGESFPELSDAVNEPPRFSRALVRDPRVFQELLGGDGAFPEDLVAEARALLPGDDMWGKLNNFLYGARCRADEPGDAPCHDRNNPDCLMCEYDCGIQSAFRSDASAFGCAVGGCAPKLAENPGADAAWLDYTLERKNKRRSADIKTQLAGWVWTDVNSNDQLDWPGEAKPGARVTVGSAVVVADASGYWHVDPSQLSSDELADYQLGQLQATVDPACHNGEKKTKNQRPCHLILRSTAAVQLVCAFNPVPAVPASSHFLLRDGAPVDNVDRKELCTFSSPFDGVRPNCPTQLCPEPLEFCPGDTGCVRGRSLYAEDGGPLRCQVDAGVWDDFSRDTVQGWEINRELLAWQQAWLDDPVRSQQLPPARGAGEPWRHFNLLSPDTDALSVEALNNAFGRTSFLQIPLFVENGESFRYYTSAPMFFTGSVTKRFEPPLALAPGGGLPFLTARVGNDLMFQDDSVAFVYVQVKTSSGRSFASRLRVGVTVRHTRLVFSLASADWADVTDAEPRQWLWNQSIDRLDALESLTVHVGPAIWDPINRKRAGFLPEDNTGLNLYDVAFVVVPEPEPESGDAADLSPFAAVRPLLLQLAEPDRDDPNDEDLALEPNWPPLNRPRSLADLRVIQDDLRNCQFALDDVTASPGFWFNVNVGWELASDGKLGPRSVLPDGWYDPSLEVRRGGLNERLGRLGDAGTDDGSPNRIALIAGLIGAFLCLAAFAGAVALFCVINRRRHQVGAGSELAQRGRSSSGRSHRAGTGRRRPTAHTRRYSMAQPVAASAVPLTRKSSGSLRRSRTSRSSRISEHAAAAAPQQQSSFPLPAKAAAFV